MNENIRAKLIEEIVVLATKYSALRVKVNTKDFDLDFKRDDDGSLYLATEKAVIRVLGKVTKVPIGENEEFSTYEAAFEATKNYWQEYYKNVRARRPDKEKQAEAMRQKRYREKRKAREAEFKHRQ